MATYSCAASSISSDGMSASPAWFERAACSACFAEPRRGASQLELHVLGGPGLLGSAGLGSVEC